LIHHQRCILALLALLSSGARASLPDFPPNSIAPLYGTWTGPGETPEKVAIAAHSITFGGSGCRYHYHVLGIRKRTEQGAITDVHIDLKLTDPTGPAPCAYEEIYLQLSLIDTGPGSENVSSWIECTSAQAFEHFKNDPPSAACSSGTVMDRYPANLE
jgi:hypothetical protein